MPDHPQKTSGAGTSAGGEAAPSLKGVDVLLINAIANEVTAFQTVLAGDGATVHVISDPRDLVQQATTHPPGVLLMDASVKGLDLGNATRILSRNPATAATAIVLLAPADADERTVRRLREFDVFGILQRPLTCSSIRNTFRSAAGFSREADKMRKSAAGEGKGRVKRVRDCGSLLKRELSCPFHSFGVPVDYFQLRTGKLASELDIFDVPHYSSATADRSDEVDYNVAGLAICRECFFTSNDPNYFEDPDRGIATVQERGASRAAYRIDPATRGKITAGSGHRGLVAYERLGQEPDAAFFSWNRTDEQALVAFELAIATSRTLYEASPVRRSLELLRLGNYELRRAMLRERTNAPYQRVMKHRLAAADWLGKAFSACKGVAMYKAAYQLAAIHIHLGRDATAFQFLGALREQTRLSIREQEDPATLERYLRRAQALWEDRTTHRHAEAVALQKAA